MHFLRENKVLLLLIFFAVLFLCVGDQRVLSWVRLFHKEHPDIGQILRTADRIMYFAAHGTTLIVGAIMLYLIGRYINRRLRDLGLSLLVGLVTSGVLVQILKHLIGRARPRITDSLLVLGPTLQGSYDSFPSGHTAMAFCLATILSHYFPPYRVLFYLFAILEGLARIDGTSHFPSDVLAGALVGIVVAKVLEIKGPVRTAGTSGSGLSKC
jgi:membrane-associated phospholipid phosphatase